MGWLFLQETAVLIFNEQKYHAMTISTTSNSTLAAPLHPCLASQPSETEYLAFGDAASQNPAAHSSLHAHTRSLGAPASPFALLQ